MLYQTEFWHGKCSQKIEIFGCKFMLKHEDLDVEIAIKIHIKDKLLGRPISATNRGWVWRDHHHMFNIILLWEHKAMSELLRFGNQIFHSHSAAFHILKFL